MLVVSFNLSSRANNVFILAFHKEHCAMIVSYFIDPNVSIIATMDNKEA